jgi:hypothetical protein
MCTLDGILIYCHKEQPHGLLAARKTLLYADLPALISFCVLLCYVFAIPFNSHIFVSGALAFQLFSSHIVFTAVEAEARMEKATVTDPPQTPQGTTAITPAPVVPENPPESAEAAAGGKG